jgi:hypothetical protein
VKKNTKSGRKWKSDGKLLSVKCFNHKRFLQKKLNQSTVSEHKMKMRDCKNTFLAVRSECCQTFLGFLNYLKITSHIFVKSEYIFKRTIQCLRVSSLYNNIKIPNSFFYPLNRCSIFCTERESANFNLNISVKRSKLK